MHYLNLWRIYTTLSRLHSVLSKSRAAKKYHPLPCPRLIFQNSNRASSLCWISMLNVELICTEGGTTWTACCWVTQDTPLNLRLSRKRLQFQRSVFVPPRIPLHRTTPCAGPGSLCPLVKPFSSKPHKLTRTTGIRTSPGFPAGKYSPAPPGRWPGYTEPVLCRTTASCRNWA